MTEQRRAGSPDVGLPVAEPFLGAPVEAAPATGSAPRRPRPRPYDGPEHRMADLGSRASRPEPRPVDPHAAVGRFAQLRQHSLIRNGAFLVATTTTTSALGYAFWIVVARISPPSTVGLASAAISAFSLAAYVGSLGAGALAIQLLPARQGAEWGNFLWRMLAWTSLISLVLGALAATALPAMSSTFSALTDPTLFIPFCLGTALTSASGILDSAMISLRRSGRQFARNVAFGIVKIMVLALPWALGQGGVSAGAIVWSWTAALALTVVVGVRVLVPAPLRGSLRHAGYSPGLLFGHWRLMSGNLFSGIGALLPPYIFPVLVAGLLDAERNAYFFFVWSISGVFFMVSAAISQAMFAEASNIQAMSTHVRSAAKACVAVLVPLVAFALLFAHPLLGLFGADYADHGVGLLRINALGAFPDAVTNIYVGMMMARRRVSAAAALNVGMAAVAVAGSVLTLPVLGINAVGWSWLAAQSAGVIAVVVLVRRDRASRPMSFPTNGEVR